MGGATSSNQNLSPHEKEIITQKLKDLYSSLSSENQSDEEIKNQLSEEYLRLMNLFLQKRDSSSSSNLHSPPHHLQPTAAYTLKVNLAAKSNDSTGSVGGITPQSHSGGRKAGGSGSGRTRRRSFDVDSKNPRRPRDTAPSTTKLGDTSASLTSKSTTSIANTDIAVDSWDSVTQQPFCEICKMAFKSPSFLERHIKYSNLHVENVKRLEGGDTAVIESHAPNKMTEEHITTKQEEGIHYRLLYSGSKFYWRCQQSIDLDVYHHFLSNTIEIIPYHATKQKELPRIYLDYELVLQQVEESIKEEVNHRKELILADRFTTPDEIDEVKLRLEVTLIKVVTYILQRITFDPKHQHHPVLVNQISSINNNSHSNSNSNGTSSASKSLKELNNAILSNSEQTTNSSRSFSNGDETCGFMALFDDNVKLFPVLHNPPVILIPINVFRRRRSTAEEFDSELRTIDKDQTIIKANIEKAQEFTKANSRAEKIAAFVFLAAQSIQEKKYSYRDIHQRYKRLWLWAIYRVLFQLQVIKNRKILNERGLNFIPKSPYKPIRMREQSVANLGIASREEDPTVEY